MNVRGFWPALPALILLGVFFLFPVVRMLGFSIEGGTLEWYAKALGEGLYLQVMWNTTRARRRRATYPAASGRIAREVVPCTLARTSATDPGARPSSPPCSR